MLRENDNQKDGNRVVNNKKDKKTRSLNAVYSFITESYEQRRKMLMHFQTQNLSHEILSIIWLFL